jgi:uncharacterized membrane protein
MALAQHKTIFLVSTVIVALFVAVPTIQQFIVFPQPEHFSELALLGSQNEAANYPSDVFANGKYTVLLDVGNHLGRSAYYMVQVKLLNQMQYKANSEVPSLCNCTFFVADKQTWELPITFSLNYSHDENNSQVNVHQITINGDAFNAENCVLPWDNQQAGFFGYLVFELWIYDEAVGDFVNHGRSVNLILNFV